MGKKGAVFLLATVAAAILLIAAVIPAIPNSFLLIAPLAVACLLVGLVIFAYSNRMKESGNRKEPVGLRPPMKFERGRAPVYGSIEQVIPSRSTVEGLALRRVPRSPDERSRELEEGQAD